MLKADVAYLISGCFIKAIENSLLALSKSVNSPPNLSNKLTSKPDELPKPRILGGEKKIIFASEIPAATPNNCPVIASAERAASVLSAQSSSLIIPKPKLLPAPLIKLLPLIKLAAATPSIPSILLYKSLATASVLSKEAPGGNSIFAKIIPT